MITTVKSLRRVPHPFVLSMMLGLIFLSGFWYPLKGSSNKRATTASLSTSPVSINENAGNLTIVATTTVPGTIAKQLGETHVTVHTLVPSGMCPGHYDIRPGDVETVNGSDLLIAHGLEFTVGGGWLDDLLGNLNPEYKPKVLNVSGEWKNPLGARSITNKIAAELKELGDFNASCEDNRVNIVGRVNETAEAIKDEATEMGVSSVNVLSMQWQVPFVNFTGFNIVDSYLPPDQLSNIRVSELISKGKEGDVALVIDNLQSGVEVGRKIAEEIGCMHVVLSNFPGAVKGAGNLTALYSNNWDRLSDGTENWRNLQDEVNRRRVAERRAWIFIITTGVLAVISAVEGVYIYVKTRRREPSER